MLGSVANLGRYATKKNSSLDLHPPLNVVDLNEFQEVLYRLIYSWMRIRGHNFKIHNNGSNILIQIFVKLMQDNY